MILKQFIKKNNLTFKEGQRNTNATVICGYALYIHKEIEDIINAIPQTVRTGELDVELYRVWDYAEANDYGNWWYEPTNRAKYGL